MRRNDRRNPKRNRSNRVMPRFRVYKNTPKRIDIHSVTYTGVMIDAVACTTPDGTEISNGYIFLDEIDDIFILRDAIDAFITKHNLTPPVK
ncbi:MAG: hypothetical protein K2G13_05855 [Muribaculaceae bacterium]|nr:hypothetical protein [Muribaculaceae bacterium]